MRRDSEFDPQDFLPYLLNQAAETLSLEFQRHYRGQYGMLRTEWRVLFHLGCYGEMTAKDICVRARLHKTKVSRAVAALQAKRLLTRRELERDRRHAVLQLTALGQRVFADLSRAAHAFDSKVRAAMTPDEAEILHRCLIRIAGFETAPRAG
ncbi:MAG: winged helix-turn-helix transcriptional regulator [Boseongicola sp. SB0662_bin_57]|nr:winged helix-turn-helix transcriptional regulator [Boseongicola sp. SB0662_bin_57]